VTTFGRARGSGTVSAAPACSSKVVRSEGELLETPPGPKLVHGTAVVAAIAGFAAPVAAGLVAGLAAFGSVVFGSAAATCVGCGCFFAGPVKTGTGSPGLTSCRSAADFLVGARRLERKTA